MEDTNTAVEARTAAARALRHVDDDGTFRALPALVKSLCRYSKRAGQSPPSADFIFECARSLRTIVSSSQRARSVFATDYGLVPDLLSFLEVNVESRTRTQVLECLASLAEDQEYAQPSLLAKGAILAVTRVLHAHSARGQRNTGDAVFVEEDAVFGAAAGCLANLCFGELHQLAAQDALSKCDGIRVLTEALADRVRLLRDHQKTSSLSITGETPLKAAVLAMANATRHHPENQRRAAHCGAIETLVALLGLRSLSSSPQVLEFALGALVNLVDGAPDLAAKVRHHNGDQALQSLIPSLQKGCTAAAYVATLMAAVVDAQPLHRRMANTLPPPPSSTYGPAPPPPTPRTPSAATTSQLVRAKNSPFRRTSLW